MMQIARRMVPQRLRPNAIAILNQFRRVRRLKSWYRHLFIRPTRFPLDPSLRRAIADSYEASNLMPTRYNQVEFPPLDELVKYWRTFRRVSEIVSLLDRDDRAYNWDRIQNRLNQFPSFIQKDLFGMWSTMNKPPKAILEIGSRTGKSIATQLLLHPFIDQCHVILIDPFLNYGSPRIVKRNLKRLGIPTNQLHILTGYSEEAFPKLMESIPELMFDYVLVDGSHSKEDALNDLRMVSPYVAHGGFCVFDDIGSYEGGRVGQNLMDVWEQWKSEHKDMFSFREYTEFFGFAVARRNSVPSENVVTQAG